MSQIDATPKYGLKTCGGRLSPDADGIPNEDGFFRGLAQAPLHFQNAIAELVDNAIAAKPERFWIGIDLSRDAGGNGILVTVMDTGPGIHEADLSGRVFKTGYPPQPGSPHLNEHGFGLKNVLAKVEAVGNGTWTLKTRDEGALANGVYSQLSRPLRYRIPIEEKRTDTWPDYGPEGTGTIVQFAVPQGFAQTVSHGKRGGPPTTLGGTLKYLREHLGVYYRGYLTGGRRSQGEITTSLNWSEPEDVDPVEPDLRLKRTVRRFRVAASRGAFEIEGEYGLIEKTSSETRSRSYYYRHSPESFGADFRIGHRVVATRLFTEIWSLARNPAYNGFWAEFKIPASREAVPRTLNNKTSLDFDDPVWLDIAAAIREKVPDPPKSYRSVDEEELRTQLADQLRAHSQDGDVIQENFPCFPGSVVLVDIFKDESHRGGEIAVYETKSGKAHPIDVYQLRMYWDGVVENGQQPTHGYLVCEGKTAGVETILRVVNQSQDRTGRDYEIRVKTWEEYGLAD